MLSKLITIRRTNKRQDDPAALTSEAATTFWNDDEHLKMLIQGEVGGRGGGELASVEKREVTHEKLVKARVERER